MTTSLERIFELEFKAQLAEDAEETGVELKDFITSGGTTRRELEDSKWWLEHGPEHVLAWRAHVKDQGWKMWQSPEGVIGVELPFHVQYENGVRHRGSIDRVVVAPDNTIGIGDLKTGNRMPETAQQLGEYKAALEVQYGVKADWGQYFKTRGARDQKRIPLAHWTPALVANILEEHVKMRAVGAYPPHLTKLCDWCSVRDACAAYGGSKAHLYDPIHPNYQGARSE